MVVEGVNCVVIVMDVSSRVSLCERMCVDMVMCLCECVK